MSVTYYSYAVIGCQIPLSKLYEEKIITYEHRHTTLPDTNFCPICGEVIRKTEVEEVDFELSVLELIWSTDRREAFIGYFMRVADFDAKHFGFMDVSDIPSMKENIRTILSPLNLWDESKFSLYIVQYCSY